MTKNIAEVIIGALVLLVAAGFVLFVGQNTGRASSAQYPIIAKFRSVEGIVVGSDVRMSGVKIGSVTALDLDRQTYLAAAEMVISSDIKIPDDSDAKVASEGLLGGAFVEITPGGSDFMLAAGDEIVDTQGAVSLLNLLIRYATGSSEQ